MTSIRKIVTRFLNKCILFVMITFENVFKNRKTFKKIVVFVTFSSFMNRFSFSFFSIDEMFEKIFFVLSFLIVLTEIFFLFLSKQFEKICFFLSQIKQMSFEWFDFFAFDLNEFFLRSSRRWRDDVRLFFLFLSFFLRF